jgi:hypothetical protein
MGIDENRGLKNESYSGAARTCPFAPAAFARVSGRRATSLRLSAQCGAKRRTRHPDDLAHLHRRLGSGFALARAPRKDDAE